VVAVAVAVVAVAAVLRRLYNVRLAVVSAARHTVLAQVRGITGRVVILLIGRQFIGIAPDAGVPEELHALIVMELDGVNI